MSRDFEAGRPSIPPEALLKAMLLQGLYAISSERRLGDALNWNLLYRWFCDLDPDAEVWDETTFTKNRERFERHGLMQKLFELVVAKVEFHFGELFPRVGFIGTNLETDRRAVVRFYNERGTAEQWIKEGMQAVKMTRLSYHRFQSNEVRLRLSVIAYNLGNLWRRPVLPKRIDHWAVTSLLQRSAKTGGRLIKHPPVLLAVVGRELSDAAALWKHGAADRRASTASRVSVAMVANRSVRNEAREGAVSEKGSRKA